MLKTVRITHLSGALAGKTQEFSGETRSIVFGREAGPDGVTFPPAEKIVGRKHFSLDNKDGGFSVTLIGSNLYVEVNGHPAEPGVPLKSGSVVRLGDARGPSFRVDFEEAAAADDDLNRTKENKVRASAFDAVGGLRKRLVLASVAAVLLFACIGGALWWIIAKERSLDEQFADLQERAKETFRSADIDRLKSAAYLVVMQDPGAVGAGDKQGTAIGTAWPVAKGLFANGINPKVVLFFLSFLPQFVIVERGGVSWQTAQLGLVFTAQAVLLFGLLGYFSGAVGQWLGRNPRAGSWLDRVAGTIFVGLGLRLIVAR